MTYHLLVVLFNYTL